MKEMKKIIALDMLSIKPYITVKNLVIMFGLSAFYAFISKNIFILYGAPAMFAILFCSYPFLIGDQAGVDALYRIFAIDQKSVVLGRYATSLLICLICTLIGACFSVVFSFFLQESNILELVMFMVPTYFIIGTFIISLQYPFYFKYGYMKAKMVMSIVFVAVGIVVFLVTHVERAVSFIVSMIKNHMLLSVGIFVVIWVMVYLGSMVLSLKWYREKDF